MMTILRIIGNGILAIIIGLFIIVIFAGIVSFSSSISKRYVISGGDINHYTDSYEEKDGCLYFTDYLGNNNKLCGYYTIRERNFQR